MTKLVLACTLLASAPLWAADKLQRLDVKLGLWETTTTSNMSGAPPIPEARLAKMSPEERAMLERMMKARGDAPQTHTQKSCLTKEKLEKDLSFGDERGKCTHDILSSTSKEAEVKFHCADENMTSDGTAKFEAVSSENVKGTVHTTVSGGGNTMKMDLTLTSRYLGSSCGDVK